MHYEAGRKKADAEGAKIGKTEEGKKKDKCFALLILTQGVKPLMLVKPAQHRPVCSARYVTDVVRIDYIPHLQIFKRFQGDAIDTF